MKKLIFTTTLGLFLFSGAHADSNPTWGAYADGYVSLQYSGYQPTWTTAVTVHNGATVDEDDYDPRLPVEQAPAPGSSDRIQAVRDNYISSVSESVSVASFTPKAGGPGDVFNLVSRHTIDPATGGISGFNYATEKYFEYQGRTCQTNYDHMGRVVYTSEGCPE